MTLKSVLLILLVIVIWGSNFAVIKIGVTAIEPLLILAMRFFLAGLIFLPFIKWPGWKKACMIMFVGLLMGPLHQGFFYVAITYLPSGLMSLIIKSNIIIVTLIGWLFLRETVGWRTWTGIFVGLAGVAILFGEPDFANNPIGYVLALISAFFLALMYIAQKKLDVTHPPTYIVLMSLPMAPFIMLSSYFIEGTGWISNIDNIDWKIVSSVVFYQAIILSLSHMLWQHLVTKMPVSQIVPWTLLIPVVAVATAVIALDETLTSTMLIGGSLTIAGVTIITFRRIKKKQA